MYYITVKVPPKYHQMSLEELIYNLPYNPVICKDETNTRTYEVEQISEHFLRGFQIEPLIEALERFNRDTDYLREGERRKHYYRFYLPKKSGGLRPIDAPDDELKSALYRLKYIFEDTFHAPRDATTIQTAWYHTTAFAYIRRRSTIDLVKRHQKNKSNWFAKLDFSNFFGSITVEFAMRMMEMVFPFCEICKTEHGRNELYKAVELGFLDGVLPQGTPLSPTLTNIIMIPFDFRMSCGLRALKDQRFVYTRYADDMIISARVWFPVKKIENMVMDIIREFNAPFHMNREKTRYGSVGGSNWNLGVVLTKEYQITIGRKNKKRFRSMLASYAMDKQHGVRWSFEDLSHVLGLYSYYCMINKPYIDEPVDYLCKQFNMDILKEMKKDLRPY